MSDDTERRFGTFLVRLWRTTSYGQPVWRVVLEDPRTGTRHALPNLSALLGFFQAWMGATSPPNERAEPAVDADEPPAADGR